MDQFLDKYIFFTALSVCVCVRVRVFLLQCVPHKSPDGHNPLAQQSPDLTVLQLHQKADSAAPHKIMADHPGECRWRISGDKHISRAAALIATKAHTSGREDKLKETF